MVEMINTSASTIEIGRNVKIGEGEPLELRESEIVMGEIRGDYRQCDIKKKGENDAVDTNRVCQVSETDKASILPSLEKVIMRKLTHLVKAERDVLGPVMKEFYDLFLYDRSGMLPCTTKGFHEIKTGRFTN
jgi:hypothetical protein